MAVRVPTYMNCSNFLQRYLLLHLRQTDEGKDCRNETSLQSSRSPCSYRRSSSQIGKYDFSGLGQVVFRIISRPDQIVFILLTGQAKLFWRLFVLAARRGGKSVIQSPKISLPPLLRTSLAEAAERRRRWGSES